MYVDTYIASLKNILLLRKHIKNISLRDILKIFCSIVFSPFKKLEADKNILFL